MRHGQIVSKFHHLVEALSDPSAITNIAAGEDLLRGGTLAAMEKAPKYCFTPEVAAIAASEAGIASVKALFQAGLGNRLPFPVVLVEVAAPGGTVFMLMREEPLSFEMDDGGMFNADFAVDLTEMAVMPEGTVIGATGGVIAVRTGTPLNPTTSAVFKPMGFAPSRDELKRLQIDAFNVILVLKTLLLMMVTDGVEKHEIVPGVGLNKARARKGKPPIPTHTVLRLGHYYDRIGQRHTVGDRLPPRLHLRAGHIRHQPYGAGRSQHKSIFIAPVLVNYHPGETAPTPTRKVTA